MQKSLHIGVLALQGAVSEHCHQLEQLGVTAHSVKKANELSKLDGLIIPGGESTAIRRLMDAVGMDQAIKAFSEQGKPILGTCAGMILLAKSITDESNYALGLMDIEVKRNAFGRQLESFETELTISDGTKEGIKNFPAIFIRAPRVEKLLTKQVVVLSDYKKHPVLVQQKHLLACAFHPELSQDKRLLSYFVEHMVSKQAHLR